MQLNFGPHRDHADHCGRATFRQHGERLFGCQFEPDSFKGVFDTTTGQIFDLLYRVACRGINEVGGTTDLRQFKLASTCVNGDDPAGPGDGSPLHGTEPDTAATDHGHGASRGHFGGVDHRPDARGHTAADQRGFIEGHIFADLDHGVFMHEELFRIGGKIGELVHDFPPL